MRLLENYVSIQGEGPNTGEPVRFLRFAGCNYRCPGWPCDTQHAIEPSLYNGKFRNVEPVELIAELDSYPRRICITGGEPFLQKEMAFFIEQLLGFNYLVDVFTNGSFLLPEELTIHTGTTFVVDWKLTGSGHGHEHTAIRILNLGRLFVNDAVKFVVKDQADLLEAFDVWDKHKGDAANDPHWYVGAVWGAIPDVEIVQFITDNELPWKLNVQQHKHIWHPNTQLV